MRSYSTYRSIDAEDDSTYHANESLRSEPDALLGSAPNTMGGLLTSSALGDGPGVLAPNARLAGDVLRELACSDNAVADVLVTIRFSFDGVLPSDVWRKPGLGVPNRSATSSSESTGSAEILGPMSLVLAMQQCKRCTNIAYRHRTP